MASRTLRQWQADAIAAARVVVERLHDENADESVRELAEILQDMDGSRAAQNAKHSAAWYENLKRDPDRYAARKKQNRENARRRRREQALGK